MASGKWLTSAAACSVCSSALIRSRRDVVPVADSIIIPENQVNPLAAAHSPRSLGPSALKAAYTLTPRGRATALSCTEVQGGVHGTAIKMIERDSKRALIVGA